MALKKEESGINPMHLNHTLHLQTIQVVLDVYDKAEKGSELHQTAGNVLNSLIVVFGPQPSPSKIITNE